MALRSEQVEAKTKKIKGRIEKLFPGLALENLKYGNMKNGKEEWSHLHFTIYPQNSNLANSPYFYRKRSIVHFTSIGALTSMLNEKSIRLYNLHSLNDPREFTFASKMFRLDDGLIEDAKDNLFIMSFCEKNILKNATEEFNMWRLYGQSGKGVAIVFTVENEPEKWNDFHYSQVVYGASKRINFTRLFLFLNSLSKDLPTVDMDLGKLYAFHKSSLFKPEMEVRLLYDRRKRRSGVGARTKHQWDQVVFPIIKNDVFKLIENRDQVRYLQIPIFNKSQDVSEEDIPLLKIDEIIIGYNVGNKVTKIIDSLGQQAEEMLGYKPNVKQSRLTKFYFDSAT